MSASIPRQLLVALLDLVLPEWCAGCGQRPGRLCAACAGRLGRSPQPVAPTPRPRGLPPVWAVAPYDGPVRSAIIAYKERGRLGLAPILGSALARSVGAAASPGPPNEPILIVPVPSSRARTRERGYDPLARVLAVAVRGARAAGVPAASAAVLRQSRRVADQAGLDAAARAANLAGALAVRPRAACRVAGRTVLVADDVLTTGATLTEASRALMAAGASVAGAAVVAATSRGHP